MKLKKLQPPAESMPRTVHHLLPGDSSNEPFNYQNDALSKLASVGGKCKITLSNSKIAPWNDTGKEDRNHYRVRLSKGAASYTLDFFGSINDARNNKEPDVYDVLACLEWHEPGTFEDFCGNFGYEQDSRSAFAIYKAVCAQFKGLSRVFTEQDREILSSIQ